MTKKDKIRYTEFREQIYWVKEIVAAEKRKAWE